MSKKIIRLFLSTLVIGSMVFSTTITFAFPQNAYADTATASEATSNCAIEWIGWLVCPVLRAASIVLDQAYQYLSRDLMTIDTTFFNSDSNNGTYTSWQQMRDIANIAFVFAFLILIYSQITGGLMSNYGIKKMLPRLIVAAILVNTSYIICQLMVDLSNIIGSNIYDFMNAMAKNVRNTQAQNDLYGVASAAQKGNTAFNVLTVAIIGAAAAWFLLPILGSVLLMALAITLIITLILLLRKALVVLLIIVSPLAFVAYLLPNTENLFKKWMSTFKTVLVLFPAASLLMGAGSLASAEMLATGSSATYKVNVADAANPDNNKSTNAAVLDEAHQTSAIAGLMSLIVLLLPWIGIYTLTTGMLSALGAVGGFVGKFTKGAENRGRTGVKTAHSNTAYQRGKAIRQQAKQNYKTRQFAERLATGKSPRAAFTRRAAGGAGGVLRHVTPRQLSGSMDAQATGLNTAAAGVAEKGKREDVDNAKSLLKQQGIHTDDSRLAKALEDALKSGNEAGAKAALDYLEATGEGGLEKTANIADAIDQGRLKVDGSTLKSLQAHITENHSGLKGKEADLYKWANLGSIGQQKSLSSIGSDKATYSALTDDKFAGQSKRSLKNAGAAQALDDADPTTGYSRATRILDNKDTAKEIKGSATEKGTAREIFSSHYNRPTP